MFIPHQGGLQTAMGKNDGCQIADAVMRICASTLPRIAEYARAGRVVVFDTETTGCSRRDEICQIAAVEYVEGRRTRTFSVYACPTCDMSPGAEWVHGLSADFLSEHGLAPEEAMHRFFEFLGDDALLVAHNCRFDMRMLAQECSKFALGFSPEGVETCDTIALARHLRPGLRSYALANLIEALGIDGTNSHDALDDALACAGLLFFLLQDLLLPRPPDHSPSLF
jgi:DNA polymerase III epsilon subunit family exonuclease